MSQSLDRKTLQPSQNHDHVLHRKLTNAVHIYVGHAFDPAAIAYEVHQGEFHFLALSVTYLQ